MPARTRPLTADPEPHPSEAAERAATRARAPQHHRGLRQDRGAARHRPGPAARARSCALLGPNGVGEEHDAQGRERSDEAERWLRPSRRPPRQRRGQRRVCRASGCARSPRVAACSRTSPCARTSSWPATWDFRSARSRNGPTRSSRDSSSVAPSWPEPCRAASSGCWRWPERSRPSRPHSCSTRCRWASRRSSSRSCTAWWATSPRSGVSILVVEQFAHIVLDVADLAVVMVQGRIAAAGRPSDIEAELSSAYLGANL